jgi:hypothetical protein
MLSGCYTYKVNMAYVCTNPSGVVPAGQVCSAWSQTGGVETPTTCFPESATVYTKAGTVPMSALNIGDEILGIDASGSVVYTPVRAWLHRDVNAETTMTVVNTKEGSVVASARHPLATGEPAYTFAGELRAGNRLVRQGVDVEVESISETAAKGAYAPLTFTSNFFVGGPDMKNGVLAHSFAEIRYPQRIESAFHAVMTVAEFFQPSIHAVGNDQAYVHPVARFFMKILGWSAVAERHVVV